MSDISRVALFGKLNSVCYKAIEGATVFCKMRGNPYVELVHWLHQILQLQDSDLHKIIRQFNLDPSRLAKDFTDALDRLPRGSTSISDLSSHVEEAVERGWVYGTLMFGESQVRSGHLVVGILKTKGLTHALQGISREFDKIKPETLTERFAEIVSGSPEEGLRASDGFQVGGGAVPGEASGAMSPAQMGKQEALKQFTVDLTEQARQGKMDPIVGRDEEIRQVIDILMRRRQNNPILTGEAGVGKTAVVEGFAQKIVAGDVPPPLRDVSLRTLDVGLLQAGASMKGEFENRLRQVIEEVQSSEKPIILFIDEAHTLVGAGGAAGTGDAANLLKPALARGTLRTVAATTWAEYKKHIEKDPALTRRFQVVQVNEPSEEKAILMMRGVASVMEKHHQVQVLDEALEAAVRLSHRYIPARQLPDKSVSLLDTASARVAISQHAVPAEVDDCRKRIAALETELAIIGREKAVGIDIKDRETVAAEKLGAEKERLSKLETRWNAERELVKSILDIRKQLRDQTGKVEGTDSPLEKAADRMAEAESAPATASVPREQLLEELKTLQAKLHELQGETPLILPSVDAQAVASVVGDWTGIPVGRMVKNEIETILHLADNLEQRIIGQRHALDMIARRIQTSRAGLDNPNKPIGVFMLAGTSGVGKTETALALAEALYGGEQNVITINMSEYQEAHTVSTLKGAPPGYVGYGEGGVLTEAVRRRPYSVVLLDEVEKAHPDVHEIFFQVFDKGWMEDGEGRVIDFKNTLILLTTNAGTDLIAGLCRDPELMPEPEGIAKALREPLLKVFPPALLGRLVVIPYYPLSDEMIGAIARLQLGRIKKRIAESHKVPFTYDDDVIKLIASRCTEVESGGRMIDAILTNTVLPRISEEFLTRMMEGKPIERVHVSVQDGDFGYGFE
ncbi:type VI secretion system ATPase TssH [Methylobacter sp. BlB1]|uniref:type VI secretion system ATPase TssH n=1 Tax=Methylobacter sp. BlB1 TaxID=2785914 RepID=UPI001894E59B|nr:type VI secretion system ATPase TssH [Methylobacter sp. BlB1]MBF6649849.1 type VI secretion system ATPase TssH [Methylobacter sp. BlB1]